MKDVKVITPEDLDNKTVVVDGNGLVAVKIYKDLIVTHGVLTVDNQGRFVMKDALVALKQPSKHNIGQANITTANEYGSTTNSRHYRLSFNFYTAPSILIGMQLGLQRGNGDEVIEPVKWVDYDGNDTSAPQGVTLDTSNGQTLLIISNMKLFRNDVQDKYLVIKHSDPTLDYDSNYASFYNEVRMGLNGTRWYFSPAVSYSGVDYPDYMDHYQLIQDAFTFNVYG